MKCANCHQEYSVNCDWRQGRCPHHAPMLTEYHFRYLNLFRFIKGLFKRGT
jgi:hypothetical protein